MRLQAKAQEPPASIDVVGKIRKVAEHVADARPARENSRLDALFAEALAKPRNSNAKRIDFTQRLVSPDHAKQLFVRHDGTGPTHESSQKPEFRLRKPKRAIPPESSAL